MCQAVSTILLESSIQSSICYCAFDWFDITENNINPLTHTCWQGELFMPVRTCSFTSVHIAFNSQTHTPQHFIYAITITHSPQHNNDPHSLPNAKISPPTNLYTCTEHNLSHIDTIQAAMVNVSNIWILILMAAAVCSQQWSGP